MISYDPLRGFKDYLPPESEILTWICNIFTEIAKRFSYREVRTPIVESFQLFALKSGEEIRESMFVFKDKAGREVALRPEITPSIIRVYLNEMKHWSKPIRVYYVGSVFRYDEPQFGRYREFTQAGAEILGGEGIYYDAELIEFLEEFYDAIDLKNRSYKVNNIAVFRELAKRARIEGEDLDKLLYYLDKGIYDKVLELFKSRGAKEEAKVIEELALIRDNIDKLSLMKSTLSKLSNADTILRHIQILEKYVDIAKSIGANISVEPSFARGIAYYTDVIFEVIVPWLAISIAGGGRYNNLTQVYGGESLSTTGFAIGIERTMLALINSGKHNIPIKTPKILFLLLIEETQMYSKIYSIVRDLRKKGIEIQLEVSSPTRLSKWLEYAARYFIDYTIIVGKKEVESNTVTIREMRNWSQRSMGLNELYTYLLNIMSG